MASSVLSYRLPPGHERGDASSSVAGMGPSLAGAGKSGAGSDQDEADRDQKWSGVVDLENLGWFFRRMYPEKTALNVAADTGLPVDSVKKWLNLEVSPSCRATFVLIGTYGPEFLSAMFRGAPSWLDRVAREERLRRLEAEIQSLEAKRQALSR